MGIFNLLVPLRLSEPPPGAIDVPAAAVGETKQLSIYTIRGREMVLFQYPKDPITEPQMMIGVYNHLLRKVYHSQKVIGSLGIDFIAIS